VVAIELLAAAQAVEYLAPLALARGTEAARAFIRSLSPRVTEDRPLAGDIESVAASIRDGSFVAAVESEAGALA
jgi:histidine ammonia-lyase